MTTDIVLCFTRRAYPVPRSIYGVATAVGPAAVGQDPFRQLAGLQAAENRTEQDMTATGELISPDDLASPFVVFPIGQHEFRFICHVR